MSWTPVTEGRLGGAYVVVNPRKVGTRKLAHEFTHVATAAYGTSAPPWLVEGTAQYIELLPIEGEPDYHLDKLRDLVRSKYLSKAKTLPTDAQFYKTPDTSYPVSWYVVDHLVHKYGRAKLSRPYQELARGGDEKNQRDQIMTAQLGRTEAQLFADAKQR